MPASTEHDPVWLSLGEASRILNVSPSTLRYWADNGRVACFRTPGGHRRFAADAIATLQQAPAQRQPVQPVSVILDQTRADLAQSQHESGPLFDDEALAAQREAGRQLLGLAVQYVARRNGNGSIMAQAEASGYKTGRRLARAGYDARGVVESFYFFSDRIVQIIVPATPTHGRIDAEQLRLQQRLHTFFRQVLLAVMAGYDEAGE